jgi:hypothetical protein
VSFPSLREGFVTEKPLQLSFSLARLVRWLAREVQIDLKAPALAVIAVANGRRIRRVVAVGNPDQVAVYGGDLAEAIRQFLE